METSNSAECIEFDSESDASDGSEALRQYLDPKTGPLTAKNPNFQD